MKCSICMAITWILLACYVLPTNIQAASKPPPDEVVQILIEGNKRFAEGKSTHSHTDIDRLNQAGTQNQGEHAYATVIACSDSRVPVERIFDAGVMDIFTIRVAGNVVDTDDAGSIEYGLAHVHTPVMVVLGHTQCGAVTAVTHALHGNGHALEINIPPLVDNIEPAVKRAMAQNPGTHGDDIIPHAIVENVWQGVEDLFIKSPSTRNLVHSGQVKVIGAVYDVGTGLIQWLPEEPVAQILKKVEANPNRQLKAMADGHGRNAAHTSHVSAAFHGEVSQEDRLAVDSILENIENDHQVTANYNKSISNPGYANLRFYLLCLVVLFVSVGLIVFYARGKDEHGNTRLQISLGSKLVASFSIVVMLLAASTTYALISISKIGEEIIELAEEIIPVTDSVSTMGTLMLEQAVALERAFRFGDEEGEHAREGFEKSIEAFELFGKHVDRELEAGIKLLEELPALNAEDAETMVASLNKLAAIDDHHHKYEMLGLKVFELLKADQTGQAQMLEESTEIAQDNLVHEIEAFVAELHTRSQEAAHKAEMDEKKAAKIIWVVSILAAMAAFSIAVFNTRSIVNPINRVIAGLHDGAEQVASASGQVSSASQQLAEGASEQAASIEETSASLEEMSSMTKQNADNAGQADGLMQEANQVVSTADQSMDELTVSMAEIAKASEETSKIIKTIDEIAFQTNLLALNAAVEAARAGEAGAGFAVVADEVRNLAMRAADAAKNTADLIEATIRKVQDGSNLVDGANEAFTKVSESASRVGELIGEIAAASSEQAQGIDQVNTAVTEMDQVTQSNAASAEESASASEEMSAQAEQMKSMVGELVTLVSGSGNGYQPASQTGADALPREPEFLSIGSQSKKQATSPGAKTKEVTPQQMIPFEDDALADF